nr:hypothetical protein L203_02658 [Cryptococcus depauperatus CBS 7841]
MSFLNWQRGRTIRTRKATEDKDINELRKISALPGGFGGEQERRMAWGVLLGIERIEKDEEEYKVHKDEDQVRLDTNRSFVTYPKNVAADNKEKMQEDLQELIVGVLRKYPSLSYFQGYHDILSVFYLTFISQGTSQKDSAEWSDLKRCAEAVSLNRVRDAMGSGMEGMMGLLCILKRVLKAADLELYSFSAKISPVPTLPFFALSWVLTLFSHDCDEVEPVQRMFDFLLARNPIFAVYLAAAILIAKKPQLFALAKQLGQEYRSDPSLLHPLFARLPPLYPDTPDSSDPPLPTPTLSDLDDPSAPNPYAPIKLSELFALADSLSARYPWDGKLIKGRQVMGPGSVVTTYAAELQGWTAAQVLAYVDVNVVLPGATSMEDEPEPDSSLQTVLTVGILLLGLGMAWYGNRWMQG